MSTPPSWRRATMDGGGGDGGGGGRRVNRAHPLFAYRCANLWAEVLNNRLYRRLRDDTGACYSASFSLSTFEFMHPAFGVINATPLASMCAATVRDAITTTVQLLSGSAPVTQAEFTEATAPIVEEVRTNRRTNSYWHSILTHMHAHDSRKRVSSMVDIVSFYTHVTLHDVTHALNHQWETLPHPLPLHAILGVSTGARDAQAAPPPSGGGGSVEAQFMSVLQPV